MADKIDLNSLINEFKGITGDLKKSIEGNYGISEVYNTLPPQVKQKAKTIYSNLKGQAAKAYKSLDPKLVAKITGGAAGVATAGKVLHDFLGTRVGANAWERFAKDVKAPKKYPLLHKGLDVLKKHKLKAGIAGGIGAGLLLGSTLFGKKDNNPY